MKKKYPKISLNELKNKLKYLQLMQILQLVRTTNKTGRVEYKFEDGRKGEMVPFYEFCGHTFKDYVQTQIEAIIPEIAQGKHDLNYDFKPQKDKEMINSQYYGLRENEEDKTINERTKVVGMLSNIINSPVSVLPEYTSLLTMLLDSRFHDGDIKDTVIKLIESSKKEIKRIGNQESMETFFREMFSVRIHDENQNAFDDKLIQTFFRSNNVSADMKKRAIEYCICHSLSKKDNEGFIKSILSIESVKEKIDFSDSLAYAIERNNEGLANHIVSEMKINNAFVYPVPLTVSRGYKMCSHFAYEKKMPVIARKILDRDNFNYSPGYDYDHPTNTLVNSFFKSTFARGDYEFATLLLSNYIISRRCSDNSWIISELKTQLETSVNEDDRPRIAKHFFDILSYMAIGMEKQNLYDQAEALKPLCETQEQRKPGIHQMLHLLYNETEEMKKTITVGEMKTVTVEEHCARVKKAKEGSHQ